MSERFRLKKQKIVEALATPDDDYTDASPKGSVDEGVRELIALINDTPTFVTTSSCAGRIAVYLEGPPRPSVGQARPSLQDESTSTLPEKNSSPSAGGKGGGRWLFTSHAPLDLSTVASPGQLLRMLGFSLQSEVSFPSPQANPQFVHFKFEPMILHILASSAEDAQALLKAALQAGFRESGISSLYDSKGSPSTPMVAVRSSGLSLDSVIGYREQTSAEVEDGMLHPMVSESYLQTIVQLANQRFATNEERKLRFQETFGHIRPMEDGYDRNSIQKASKKASDREHGVERERTKWHVDNAFHGGEPDAETQDLDGEVDYDLTMLVDGEVEQIKTK